MFDKHIDSLYEENLISKLSTINDNVSIGKSNQIFDNVYIDSFVQVGNNNILNIKSTLAHQTIIPILHRIVLVHYAF